MSTPVLVLIIVLVGLACFAGGFFCSSQVYGRLFKEESSYQ